MIIGLALALAALSLDMTAVPPGASAAPAGGDAPDASTAPTPGGDASDTSAAPTPGGDASGSLAAPTPGGDAQGTTAAPTGGDAQGTSAAPTPGADAPDASAAPTRGDAPAPEPGAAAPAGTSVFRGYAFDTCVAPSADTMRRWKSSKYRAIGVYYAGRGRACKNQPNLSRSWMRAVHANGWRVLPVYVGSQSPCVGAKNKKGVPIGRYPRTQGKNEGRDAVTRAKAYGIQAGSALYLDMEAYSYKKAACARTTLSFVQAWNRAVRASGYLPGFYSSADSGVRHMDMARRAGEKDLPSVMWFARWRIPPRLYGEPALGENAWRPARRIHQYAGNVKERHGGRTLVIDRNLMHAPVARFR